MCQILKCIEHIICSNLICVPHILKSKANWTHLSFYFSMLFENFVKSCIFFEFHIPKYDWVFSNKENILPKKMVNACTHTHTNCDITHILKLPTWIAMRMQIAQYQSESESESKWLIAYQIQTRYAVALLKWIMIRWRSKYDAISQDEWES